MSSKVCSDEDHGEEPDDNRDEDKDSDKKTQRRQGRLMLAESDLGVNDGRAMSFGVSTLAVRGGIFKELHKKDEIFYEALFWSEARKSADFRRRSP